MTLLVPNSGEVDNLTKFLNEILTLKLYSNNKTPAEGDTAASYTEVAGGGYLAKTLAIANWVITSGDPTIALYNTVQTFSFTGVTNAPGVIYGYYVVNGSGTLKWAERFPEAVLPFTPVNTSIIKVTPRFEGS